MEAETSETGGESLSVTPDVVNEGHWKEAVEAAVQRFGNLDVLINNAGIFKLVNAEKTTFELWDEIMGMNAKGVFLETKYDMPEMGKIGGGSIVNISSVAGLIGTRYSAADGASKGAVRLLTKSTAIQYAKENIPANSIHPGVIETPMTAPNQLADEQARKITKSRHPIGRLGQPEDAAYGAPFLASEESSIHGGQRAGDRWPPNSPIKCGNVTSMTLRQVLARSRLDADDLVPVG